MSAVLKMFRTPDSNEAVLEAAGNIQTVLYKFSQNLEALARVESTPEGRNAMLALRKALMDIHDNQACDLFSWAEDLVRGN